MRPEVESVYPLSPMQEGMLFHTLYAPESGVYLVQTVYPMRGRLNPLAFERAWQSVVGRHAALRTGFVWEDLKKPVQVVERRAKVTLNQLDWRGLPTHEQGRRLSEFLSEDRARGFDLSAPPLMRLTLIREADEAYKFVWSWHHLLMDGWSSSLVVEEAQAFYESFVKGGEPVLRPVRPFQEYIAWLKRQDPAAAEGYWRRALKGFTSPTRVGLMAPRGKTEEARPRYAEEHVRLSADASAALRATAARRRLTLNTLAQGAWALLLSRYSNEEDVLFGAVVSGRPAELPGVESMVGLFINTLPVRARVGGRARVWEWLRSLQTEQAEARRYEYTPLVQAQGWGEVPRGVELFEALFVFENYSARKPASGEEARGERVRSYEQVNYPLTAVVVPGAQLTVEVNYDCSRMDARGARQVVTHYARLLEALAHADDSARVSDLEMLSDEERRQIVSGWNETKEAYPDTACIHELFEGQAARAPEATALVFEHEELSYEELNRRSNRLAHYLRRSGVGPEVSVGICMDRSVEMVVGVLGILKAGGAYVPLDPAYPRDRLSFMIEDSRVPLLLTHAAAAASLPACPARLLLIDELSEVLSAESGENPEPLAVPDNLAYVIYTSGSTGTPKGALLHHRGLCNLARAQAVAFGIGPADRVLQFASLSFDASTFEFCMALCAGASLHLAPREQLLPGEGLERLLAERGITAVTLTPTAVEVLEPERARGLRTLIVVGEACRPELARRWAPGRRFYNGYGPTEATVCASVYRSRGEEEGRVPIGRPITNTRLYVLDAWLRPVPVGAAGELHIGGIGLARGYLGRPALTAQKFIPDPFGAEAGARLYKTGDLARFLPGGDIEFLGRNDGQIKLRGFRIELEEIERCLGEHPQVRGCAAVVREDGAGDRRLVAYVAAERESAPSSAQLREFLREKLPEYMVPAAFVMMERLPFNASGKVDRRALPDAPEGAEVRETPFVAPRNELELRLVHIWEEVFGSGPIGVTDDFFELGGHSLLAVRLAAQIHKQFGRSVPLSVLLEGGNVANLAKVLRPQADGGGGTHSPLVAIQPRGDRRPFFCVHAIGGQVLGYYHLARRLGPQQPFYGLQAPFLTEVGDESESIERMAAEYVAAVRSVQPEGPYLLGGYSFGGFVAFEMARQLRGRGEEVALLAVMDTGSPYVYHQLPKDDDEAYTLAMLARVRAREVEKDISLSHEHLRELSPDEQLRHVFGQLKRAGIFDEGMTEELGTQYIRGFVRGHRARQRAVHEYRPGVYDGKVTLFRCSEMDPRQLEVFERFGVDIEEASFGWRELTTEAVEVHEVPGYHERMCQEPHVQVLAERLGRCIEEAESCPVR